MSTNPKAAAQWSSRFAFLMAGIGAAVGLGNLWRFPFMTGQNGGAAFVIIYLFCVAFIAYPILMGELAVGRRGGKSPVGSTLALACESGRSPAWSVTGWVGVLAGFFIMTTYSVIGGQVMAYSAMSFLGEFSAREAGEAAIAAPLYDSARDALLWHSLFMGATVAIVAGGVNKGIERASTLLMPLFFVMLAGLCVYALMTGDAAHALTYLFEPDFSAITPAVVLAALGQAFFSVGVGMAIMLAYGSFLPKSENVSHGAAIIAGSDTLVAIVAGVMIFPIVFAVGLDPAAGPSLIFGALPAVFSGMPAGSLIGGSFFFLAFIAALTSAISLILAVAMVFEEQFGLSRVAAAFASGGATWVIGAASVLIPTMTPWLDFVGGSVLLPLGGLLIAIFAGWVAPIAVMREELKNTSDPVFRFWRFFIRYLAPLAVLLIFVLGLDAEFGWGLAKLIGG